MAKQKKIELTIPAPRIFESNSDSIAEKNKRLEFMEMAGQILENIIPNAGKYFEMKLLTEFFAILQRHPSHYFAPSFSPLRRWRRGSIFTLSKKDIKKLQDHANYYEQEILKHEKIQKLKNDMRSVTDNAMTIFNNKYDPQDNCFRYYRVANDANLTPTIAHADLSTTNDVIIYTSNLSATISRTGEITEKLQNRCFYYTIAEAEAQIAELRPQFAHLHELVQEFIALLPKEFFTNSTN